MKTLARAEILKAFGNLFASAQHEMFKVEVLQDYSAVDNLPTLHAWLQGDQKRSKELGKNDASIKAWREQCLASPAKITRVHVVREPYTSYLEWEIEVIYKDSLLASGAETVLLAPLSRLSGIRLPAGDLWIFDSKRALQWEYKDGAGELVGGSVWDEHDDISGLLALRKKLLAAAEPIPALRA